MNRRFTEKTLARRVVAGLALSLVWLCSLIGTPDHCEFRATGDPTHRDSGLRGWAFLVAQLVDVAIISASCVMQMVGAHLVASTLVSAARLITLPVFLDLVFRRLSFLHPADTSLGLGNAAFARQWPFGRGLCGCRWAVADLVCEAVHSR